MNKHYLIVDISNIAHMCRHQNKDADANVTTALTLHVIFQMLKKYHKKLNPTTLILAFDKKNWRKEYTMSDKCISGNIYKGDRNKNLTKSETEALELFNENLNNFETLIKEHTGIITFSADGCEADDFIGRFCQIYAKDHNTTITILSSDKDYMQCLKSPNIKLMNPLKEQYRTLEDYDYNMDWYLFYINMRAGDDNIKSAYPRVRKTRLLKAFNDDFEMANLMNEEWTHPNGTTFNVGELYKENCLLKNLDAQPEHIIELMDKHIEHSMNNPARYSHFHFLSFCGKYDLKNIVKYIDSLIPILNNKQLIDNTSQFYT